jgi:membrane protein implicated in regulation of membrane protease activity
VTLLNAKVAAKSLLGHIVLFQATLGGTLFVLLLGLNYFQGTLTLPWALWIAFVSTLTGLIVAIFVWYAITEPTLRRMKDRR